MYAVFTSAQARIDYLPPAGYYLPAPNYFLLSEGDFKAYL
jgi:hypothetical protein